MDKKEETFSYTYSAEQQEEIEKIRRKYLPKEETKMDQLRRLDRRATSRGRTVSLTWGIICTLIMGTGMSAVMVGEAWMLVPGIIIGVIGMAGVCVTYPLYVCIVKRERKKIAPQILKLSEELMEER